MIKTFFVSLVFFVAFNMAGVNITAPQFVLGWFGFYVITKLAKKNNG